MAKILEKINGNRHHIYLLTIIGLVLTSIGLLLFILNIALATREKIGRIEAISTNNAKEIGKADLRMKDETSRIDMGGCRVANENAKAIARLEPK